jgi:hypothetical protein
MSRYKRSCHLLSPDVLPLLLARTLIAHDTAEIVVENLRRFVMDEVGVEIESNFS